MAPPSFDLPNGRKIPSIGLGTWAAPPGEVEKAVETALRGGYRHIDGALIYKNEAEVGEGIRRSGVAREDLFITSKLWNVFHPNAAESLRRTLASLGTDYLDLYLVHWPVRLVPNEQNELLPVNPDGTRAVDRDWDVRKTWAQMEDLLDSGLVRAIGVCNWSVPYLESLKRVWRHRPSVNQVELHPYLPQRGLVDWCRREGILVEAYSPLGGPGAPILADPLVRGIAERKGCSPAAVLIAYHVGRGVVALVKSVTPSRLEDNLRAAEALRLADDDVAALDALSASHPSKHVRYQTPLWGFDLGFDDWYGHAPGQHAPPEGEQQ